MDLGKGKEETNGGGRDGMMGRDGQVAEGREEGGSNF